MLIIFDFGRASNRLSSLKLFVQDPIVSGDDCQKSSERWNPHRFKEKISRSERKNGIRLERRPISATQKSPAKMGVDLNCTEIANSDKSGTPWT